jgi:hypothetical protein
MLQVPFCLTKLFENYSEQLFPFMFPKLFFIKHLLYDLCYQWTSLDIDTRNEKSGFGRKNKAWQDESTTSKWMLMGLY